MTSARTPDHGQWALWPVVYHDYRFYLCSIFATTPLMLFFEDLHGPSRRGAVPLAPAAAPLAPVPLAPALAPAAPVPLLAPVAAALAAAMAAEP